MKLEELKEKIRGSYLWMRGDLLEFISRAEKNPPAEFVIKDGRIMAKGDQTSLIEPWMWGDQKINVRMIPTGTNLLKVILGGSVLGIPIKIDPEMEHVVNANINGLHGYLGFHEVFSIVIDDSEMTMRMLSFFTQHMISLMKDRKLITTNKQLVNETFDLALEDGYSDVAQKVIEEFNREITTDDIDKMIEKSVDAEMTELTMSLIRIKHDSYETSDNVMRL